MDLFARLFAHYGLKDHSTLESVAHTQLPILFIHGTGDRFVPCEMTRKAYNACVSEKHMVLVDGAGHGESFLVDQAACKTALESFFLQHS